MKKRLSNKRSERPAFKVGTLNIRLDSDTARFANGVAYFRFADTSAEVTDDDGKSLGTIGSGVGTAGVVATLSQGDGGVRSYYIPYQDLWDAVLEADKQYMASAGPVVEDKEEADAQA